MNRLVSWLADLGVRLVDWCFTEFGTQSHGEWKQLNSWRKDLVDIRTNAQHRIANEGHLNE